MNAIVTPSSHPGSIEVLRYLLQRPPFLFADSAEVDADLSHIVTQHEFLPDEPYFKGHFPGDPVVPGVVLLECMAQAGRLLLNLRAGGPMVGFLVGIESARFNQIVRPNDRLRFEARLLRGTGALEVGARSGVIHSLKCAAYNGATRCARAQIDLYQAAPPLNS